MASPTTRVSFPIPSDLAAELDEVVARLRGDDPRASVERLIRLVQTLTDMGLDYYFHEPVRRMEVSSMARQSVRLGLSAASRAVFQIMRRIVESLSDRQLATLADFLEELPVGVVGEEAA